MKRKPYYAVKAGYIPGIYECWNEAKEQVEGYSSAKYKKFFSKQDVERYMASGETADSQKGAAHYRDQFNGEVDRLAKIGKEMKGK